ncbi:type I secretion system permease/ATPase [Sphingobium yanoikuyae]|uniref:Type I secretion system permease/ATPase n=2 Tax=Sphingobium yanoikuyae TaxID=13690 RepID=A0A6P1GQG3_SPHYA|nr:type I secretion system permease/ATPase [Sphingobium yanoikuyae]
MNENLTGPIAAALRLCRRHLVGAALFSALMNLLYIAPTLYMLQVYDRVVPTQGLQTLFFLTLVLLFALGTLALLDRLRTRLLVRGGLHLNMVLSPQLLDATLGRPDMTAARQALREFDLLRGAVSGPAALALFDAPWVPFYLIVCFLVHPGIGALALIGSALLPLLAYVTERNTRRKLDGAQVVANHSYASQEMFLAGAEVIRALGMRRALVALQLRQREAMLTAQTGASFDAGTYLAIGKFVRLAMQSLALGLGALLAIDGQISAGAIFASAFLIARALQPTEQLIASWKTIAQARQSYANIETLLAAMPVEATRTLLPPPTGRIEVEGLTVLGPNRDRPILQNVSFLAEKGEAIAIVGPSGAGKSTLVRALAGAILPDRGVVRFDGSDRNDWDPERLARSIGYLPQAPTLLVGTVSDNIARFSADNGDREQIDNGVVKAAERVMADGLIRNLPNGFDYRLGLGGDGLSAGQAQRIALARALFGDPALLILDEPNAHLDAEGDAALISALAAFKAEGKTILIVSHKLSILPIVDRLMVLRDGRVDMYGPRDDILPKIAPPAIRQRPSATPAGGAA